MNMKRISFAALLISICAVSLARDARGIVSCGKDKLSGVLVTDGTNFTRTDRKGRFAFEIEDDASFVYIITPSGYAADWSSGVPAFYQKADKEDFTFDLKKLKSSDIYNIIAVGDPQPREDAHFEEFAGIPLEDMATMASQLEGVTLGIALGDICYDKLHLQKRWKEEIPRTGIPFYPSIGNHDHDRRYNSEPEALLGYRENFGPENFAFFIGDDLMIVLDDIIYNGRSNYKEGYTDDILKWVEKLMAYVSEDADIYVVQHSPLNGRHYGKMIINHDVMLDLLKGHKVLFLSGHNHTSGSFEYAENVREHNIAAICGTWWDAYHCTDGTPRGYKVYTNEDGHLSWYYKAIGRDRSFQFEVFKPGECPLNKESLVVNIWDYDPCWRVEWYQDGEYMGLMKQVEEYSPLHTAEIEATFKALGRPVSDYKRTRLARHYFAADPASKADTVEVKVTDRFGNIWRQTVSLK